MKNPYISQVLSIQEEVKKQLPYGLETTADLLLEFMSVIHGDRYMIHKYEVWNSPKLINFLCRQSD